MLRVTHRDERPLAEVVPGVRRASHFDAAEGARQLSFITAEIEPGREIPMHRHEVEEGFYVLEGEGMVVVGDEARPLRAGAFCVMPAREFHTLRAIGTRPLSIVAAFAGVAVKREPKP